MASTTVEVIHDEYDIDGYLQYTSLTNPEKFSTKELVRYTLMERDGKISGFTPVESVILQLELIRQMWQNMLSLHKNGGHPDKIISIENIRQNSPDFKRIEEQLLKYKQVETKHGHLLFTGKLQVEDLTQLDTMQFKDMGLYITGLVAMQWGIPRSSIPYIIGGTNTKDDTGGNSERGYWQVISNFQKTFADTMNTQLWIPYFGVKIVFDNPYFQLDIQRQNATQMKLNNVQLMDSILNREGLQIAKQKRLRLLDLSEEEVEEAKVPADVQNTLDQQPSKDEVEGTDGKRNAAKRKKDEQTASNNSAGKPTGFGKTWDAHAEIEFKQMIGQDVELIPLNMFVKLYNQDKSYHAGMPPRIFMRQNPEFTSLKFKSSDFIYMTRIPTDQMESNQILLMNLGDNIFIL